MDPEQSTGRGNIKSVPGAPGWLSRLSVQLHSGHDLTVPEFEPRIRLCADSSEPGACFGFCVSLSLWPSPRSCSVSLCLKNNKCKKKKIKKNATLPFVTAWMDLESIMLSEISHKRKTNTTLFHFYVESKNQPNNPSHMVIREASLQKQ